MSTHERPSINKLRIEGFKSFRDRVELDVRNLTLLAGQNSSGKSTLMQPLLLAKQTLEASYDPGVLLLNGPLFKGATAQGLLWKGADAAERWSFGFRTGQRWAGSTFTAIAGKVSLVDSQLSGTTGRMGRPGRVFMNTIHNPKGTVGGANAVLPSSRVDPPIRATAVNHLLRTWHLPGLRGSPERLYPISNVEGMMAGSFVPYAASMLLKWQDNEDERYAATSQSLLALGLAKEAFAFSPDGNDTAVELRVGRTLSSGWSDSVNIADVGIGVSQVLPVVVALLAAEPGQLLHIEQPELHLHPKAQVAMAGLLVDAALRGVQVVCETHSSVLLTAVQVAVASGRIRDDQVALHWFSRDSDGATRVDTASLDRGGTYGDWPVDFADVELEVEHAFIDASFAHEPE